MHTVLPATHTFYTRKMQDQEHYIRNELVNVATSFTDLGRMKAWVKLSARSEVEPLEAWMNMHLSLCVNQLR